MMPATTVGADELLRLLRNGPVHVVAAGGAGMSALVRLLLDDGVTVSGSDSRDSATLQDLRARGADVHVGHDAAQVADAALVVVSTAVREDNPEVVAALAAGVPVVHRSVALAGLMHGDTVVAVAGTHGKTTTTSMVTVAARAAGLDPSYAIGGDMVADRVNARRGSDPVFVAEADESDGSFLAYRPDVAVVSNVEADHLDHHGTVEAYVAVFDAFLDRIDEGGVLVACADDAGSAALAERAAAKGIRVRRYGRRATAPSDATLLDYRPAEGGGLARVSLDGQEIEIGVAVPGEHMAGNALAALLAGLELGAPLAELGEGIAAFGGVRRRFEYKGAVGGVRVYDDYAHHPTEVDAQLRAVRPAAAGGRVVVVFQPHMYSRTETFAAEFATALGLADEVVVLDVFGAREEPRPGVTGALIADAVPLPAERVHYEPAFDKVPELLAGLLTAGDLVLTMGAGDVTMLGPEVLAELERRSRG